MYYDPLVDVQHRLPAAMALTTSFYAGPQVPEDAQRLFEAARVSAGWGAGIATPLRANRGTGSSLVLARDWGLTDLEAALVDAIEASYEPSWDADSGEFTWGMGLDEEHPRGQFNAFLAAAEASGAGMWTGLAAAPLEACPQVVDVDFPDVALTRAEWIDGALYIRLTPRHEDPNARTSFRIVGAEPRQWEVSGIDGCTVDLTTAGVHVRAPRIAGELAFTPSSY